MLTSLQNVSIQQTSSGLCMPQCDRQYYKYLWHCEKLVLSMFVVGYYSLRELWGEKMSQTQRLKTVDFQMVWYNMRSSNLHISPSPAYANNQNVIGVLKFSLLFLYPCLEFQMSLKKCKLRIYLNIIHVIYSLSWALLQVTDSLTIYSNFIVQSRNIVFV